MLNRIVISLFCSLISSLAGWAAGVVAIVVFSGILFHGDVFGFAMLVGLFSGPVILLVCLVLLWPLYALIPRASILWRPGVCAACGVAAGGLLAAIVYPMYGSEYGGPLFAAPIIGGVTCLVGCKLNSLPGVHAIASA